jgi:N-methylhydantoinase B
VVVDDSGAPDPAATEELRTRLRTERPDELPVFDKGPEMDVILANCLEETGLPAPTRPVWA